MLFPSISLERGKSKRKHLKLNARPYSDFRKEKKIYCKYIDTYLLHVYTYIYMHIAKLELHWLSLSCYVYLFPSSQFCFSVKRTLEGISLYRRATAVLFWVRADAVHTARVVCIQCFLKNTHKAFFFFSFFLCYFYQKHGCACSWHD